MYLRNKLYDRKFFTSTQPDIPTISVGNLCVGGTGKTPHIEYLIQILKSEFYIATLSRGYGRDSSGFILADTQSNASDIGDEPMQFKKKFNGIRVAVDEKRVRGIEKLLENYPSLQAILLDDAFQHRAIQPGLSILLTDFSKLYVNDFILPTGQLREFCMGARRANIIIVTKCPHVLLPIERKRLIDEIKPQQNQQIYFSSIKYGDFIPLFAAKNPFTKEYYFERNFSILLLTGIANTSALSYYLKDKIKNIEHLKFPDHHDFSKKDLEKVRASYNSITATNKIILTTEKDSMRLKNTSFLAILKDLPVFYIPIEVVFDEKDKNALNSQIIDYVRTHPRNRELYPE